MRRGKLLAFTGAENNDFRLVAGKLVDVLRSYRIKMLQVPFNDFIHSDDHTAVYLPLVDDDFAPPVGLD